MQTEFLLLSLIGLIAIIFNRFAVEETRRIVSRSTWGMPGPQLSRTIVILAGIFLIVFGLLMALGLVH